MLLEGGPRLAGSFLDAGEIDEMRLFIAPIAVGGRGARVPLEGEGSGSIADAQQARSVDVEHVDEDVLIRRGCESGSAPQPLFTGLVQELGRVVEAAPHDGGARLRIEAALRRGAARRATRCW